MEEAMAARQDATNEVETIWSVDNDNAQVSRVDLPSAASGVRQRWSRWNQENDAKVMWRRRYAVVEQATGQEQQRKQAETTQRHRRRNQRPREKRGPKIDAERRRAAAEANMGDVSYTQNAGSKKKLPGKRHARKEAKKIGRIIK